MKQLTKNDTLLADLTVQNAATRHIAATLSKDLQELLARNEQILMLINERFPKAKPSHSRQGNEVNLPNEWPTSVQHLQ